MFQPHLFKSQQHQAMLGLSGEMLYLGVQETIHEGRTDVLRALREAGRFELRDHYDLIGNRTRNVICDPHAAPMIDALGVILGKMQYLQVERSGETGQVAQFKMRPDMMDEVRGICMRILDQLDAFSPDVPEIDLMDFERSERATRTVVAAIGCAAGDLKLLERIGLDNGDIFGKHIDGPIARFLHVKGASPVCWALAYENLDVVQYLAPEVLLNATSYDTNELHDAEHFFSFEASPLNPELVLGFIARLSQQESAAGVGFSEKSIRWLKESFLPKLLMPDYAPLQQTLVDRFPAIIDLMGADGLQIAFRSGAMPIFGHLLSRPDAFPDIGLPLTEADASDDVAHLDSRKYLPADHPLSIFFAELDMIDGEKADATMLLVLRKMVEAGQTEDLRRGAGWNDEVGRGPMGLPPLHMVAAEEMHQSLIFLLDLGCDTTLQDRSGRTAAQYSDALGKTTAATMIRSHAARREASSVADEILAASTWRSRP